MPDELSDTAFFVIKAEELTALNHLPADHPRPQKLEWINRGTDQRLRRSTVEMLIRTLFRGSEARSVVALHQSSGLRVIFGSEHDRLQFATLFRHACEAMHSTGAAVVAALFDQRDRAEAAILQLHELGVASTAMSALWVADSAEWVPRKGHSPSSIAGAVAGGGVVGALLGIGILATPGVGPLFAAGAIAAAAIPSVTSLSAVVGATGGAIAKLLTDQDVDSRDALYYEDQIVHGYVFVMIDCRETECDQEAIRAIIADAGGSTERAGR